jgi:transcriptional regulator with XRE-family HTH domain
MTIQELFIANLKDYRKLRAVSQARLAERCDTSQAYIAEIEVGKKFPSPAMIEKIAAALQIESYRLFGNDPIQVDAAERTLSPVKRRELAEKISIAVAKIVKQY